MNISFASVHIIILVRRLTDRFMHYHMSLSTINYLLCNNVSICNILITNTTYYKLSLRIFFKHEDASMYMFQHMIDTNEKLKNDFKKEFDVTNDQELQEIIRFIKDLIIGKVNIKGIGFGLWCFSATFNNISVISWRLFVLVEESGVLGETHHRPDASH